MSCPLCGSHAFDVLGWLERKHVHLRPGTAYVLRHLIENPTRYAGIADLAADFGFCPTRLRFWMRKKNLPPPARWLHLARALHYARLLHERRDHSVYRVSVSVGFSDHSSLSRLLTAQFGITATEAKEGIPPEVLMERWWEKEQSRKRVPHPYLLRSA